MTIHNMERVENCRIRRSPVLFRTRKINAFDKKLTTRLRLGRHLVERLRRNGNVVATTLKCTDQLLLFFDCYFYVGATFSLFTSLFTMVLSDKS